MFKGSLIFCLILESISKIKDLLLTDIVRVFEPQKKIVKSEISIKTLKLYPNPISDYINFSGLSNEQKTINIYTQSGKLVYNTITFESQINISNEIKKRSQY